jgi:hypothetical protein
MVTLLVGSVAAGTVPAEEVKPVAAAAADVLVPRGAYEAARQLAAEHQRQSTSDSSCESQSLDIIVEFIIYIHYFLDPISR